MTSVSHPPVSTRLSLPQNDGWHFLRDAPETPVPTSDSRGWQTVTLPHTPRIENEVVQFPFQGICWYRKTIPANAAWAGLRVGLEFGAAMQIADVWINGEHVLHHLGGYLPFTVDLSEILESAGTAEIAIRLDNRDTDLCPPGKPLADMDFSYFGGLYREARLVITHPLHVSDPLRVNHEAGGGVFVRTEKLNSKSATLSLKTHVANASSWPIGRCRVISKIFAPDGALVTEVPTFPVMIAAEDGHHFVQNIEISSPATWHPDTPNLYRLVTEVYTKDTQTDRLETRFGIRRLAVDNRFHLNGEVFPIRGTNRHQDHPFVGNAVPPNAQRRDAQRIRDAGFNLVRLSHYPQDPSFLDACDELGLLVQAAVPGWQQFWFNPSFIRQSFRDIRELIRRDRNHPSIVIWEPNLNETGVGEEGEAHADWCRAAHEITHAEYPGDQCFTFGDDYPEKPGWDWDVRGFVREYGDFAFGGNESTSRHRRGDGEAALLQQAWNYQWTLNHLNAQFQNSAVPYPGCATWVMFDYNRGYHPDSCNCGAMNIFRLPKYVHAFYQSQRDPRLVSDQWESGPMVFIASDWTAREGATKVTIYSNCDEVELFLNGESLGRRNPDAGPDTPYSTAEQISLATVGDNYDRSGGNPFDGGNANHLPHPPLTFTDIPYEAGKLTAVGYIQGTERARHSVRTPGKPVAIRLDADLRGLPPADTQQDLIFLHATVVDDKGTPVPQTNAEVTFSLSGDGELIGKNPARAEAGIASILVRTRGGWNSIRVEASSPGFQETLLELAPAIP